MSCGVRASLVGGSTWGGPGRGRGGSPRGSRVGATLMAPGLASLCVPLYTQQCRLEQAANAQVCIACAFERQLIYCIVDGRTLCK